VEELSAVQVVGVLDLFTSECRVVSLQGGEQL